MAVEDVGANAIDVCITFDTTGSMYPCLSQTRRVIADMVKRLFGDIPDLRIAIIAHGDYCDRNDPYVTKIMDFSSSPSTICSFVQGVEPTGGGDSPECYELVLREARTLLNWKSGRSKVIVMIGDDIPHGPNYPSNKLRIDWRNELGLMLEANINVYGVHAMPGIRRHSKHFYTEIANKTGGFYLTLDQFASVTDLIMGVCYKQQGQSQFKDYFDELEKEGRLNRGLRNSFNRMFGVEVEDEDSHEEETYRYDYDAERSYRSTVSRPSRPVTTATVKTVATGLVPVPSGRFQVMMVDVDTPIKGFVEGQGVTFNKGRGFYQLTKAEDVQQYKEIILMDKVTGDFYSGTDARTILSLQPQTEKGGVTERLHKQSLDKYMVFIQSTSVNRKLVKGTNFLYEVSDWLRSE